MSIVRKRRVARGRPASTLPHYAFSEAARRAAVDDAIAASRPKIGRREAALIHRLLSPRLVPDAELEAAAEAGYAALMRERRYTAYAGSHAGNSARRDTSTLAEARAWARERSGLVTIWRNRDGVQVAAVRGRR